MIVDTGLLKQDVSRILFVAEKVSRPGRGPSPAKSAMCSSTVQPPRNRRQAIAADDPGEVFPDDSRLGGVGFVTLLPADVVSA